MRKTIQTNESRQTSRQIWKTGLQGRMIDGEKKKASDEGMRENVAESRRGEE